MRRDAAQIGLTQTGLGALQFAQWIQWACTTSKKKSIYPTPTLILLPSYLLKSCFCPNCATSLSRPPFFKSPLRPTQYHSTSTIMQLSFVTLALATFSALVSAQDLSNLPACAVRPAYLSDIIPLLTCQLVQLRG